MVRLISAAVDRQRAAQKVLQFVKAKAGFLRVVNDGGLDYVIGVKEVLDRQFDRMVIKSTTYEPADPTIDSQIVTLQSAGVDTLIAVTVPKFAV